MTPLGVLQFHMDVLYFVLYAESVCFHPVLYIASMGLGIVC